MWHEFQPLSKAEQITLWTIVGSDNNGNGLETSDIHLEENKICIKTVLITNPSVRFCPQMTWEKIAFHTLISLP